MFSPEKSQLEICLLKTTLDEIENELVVQRTSWPDLDEENERKFKESLNAVRTSRALSIEIENLNQENIKLVAKRMHLKTRSEELAKALERALEDRKKMELSLDQEHQDIELKIRKYEDSLREKAERFRKARVYYKEDEMLAENEKIKNEIAELEKELVYQKACAEEKRKQHEELKYDISDDILRIVGKNGLEEKVKSSEENCVLLEQKRDVLLKKNNPFSLMSES